MHWRPVGLDQCPDLHDGVYLLYLGEFSKVGARGCPGSWLEASERAAISTPPLRVPNANELPLAGGGRTGNRGKGTGGGAPADGPMSAFIVSTHNALRSRINLAALYTGDAESRLGPM